MAEKMKIVMIDDEKDLCLMVKDNLEDQGKFEVATTTDPTQARDLCLQEKPDIILLDIVMPKLEGTQVIRLLREDAQLKDTPIIVLSGLGEMAYSKRGNRWSWQPNQPLVRQRSENVIKERSTDVAAEKYDVEAYLHKPFSTESLVETLQRVFKEQQKRKQQQQEEERRPGI